MKKNKYEKKIGNTKKKKTIKGLKKMGKAT